MFMVRSARVWGGGGVALGNGGDWPRLMKLIEENLE